ncbi:winged helix-turn-helix domain-containing protein [Methanococcoides methylutens]|uniref:Transcriptional regulator, ArsR family n=1 Tax=Methanococcoides methylutens MM1 TaxID=1434104 RepID=A0A0E3SSM3_METMT|nr:winged helix-turn-helix domain-containing protein [Methanococcoides methylutens]AKB86196.1 Transcriptional regulator, ArsR family [Methanococcoides methylutens MM1]
MTEQKLIAEDITLLHEEISGLRSELNRFRGEVAGSRTNSLLNELRNQCAVEMVNGSLENAYEIIGNEEKECPMQTKCIPHLVHFFEELVDHTRNGQITVENIEKIRQDFEKIREMAPYDHCSNCIQKTEGYFDQQVRMLQTIGVYQNESNVQLQVRDIQEEQISSLIGDPLSSSVRVRILKALYEEGKTFTELSKLTDLRGGNLLFHLEKLQSKGMIRQRGERGEYQISLQGYEALNAMAVLVEKLGVDYSKKGSI